MPALQHTHITNHHITCQHIHTTLTPRALLEDPCGGGGPHCSWYAELCWGWIDRERPAQRSLKSGRADNNNNHGKRILVFFDQKTFTVDPVFHKPNNLVGTFGNDISKHCRVSTTKYSFSIIMLGVVASNGKKMPPVWFERCYRLISAVYEEVLEAKVLL